MEKLKDFLYEQSDIFFTILVVGVVIGVVAFNMYGWFDINNSDNNYTEIADNPNPQPSLEEENQPDNEDELAPDNEEVENPENNSPAETPKPPTETTETPVEPPVEVSPSEANVNRTIEVAPGSASATIANSLQNQGLIISSDEFLKELIASGKETKLKAGTFTIPQSSSITEIINILTK